jgi:O-antigen ligase
LNSTSVEFLKKSIAFVREAPVIGHGTGSIPELFRRSTLGQTGAASIVSVNPHNQILAVAIQIGAVDAAVLLAMWLAHFALFYRAGLLAWIGTVVVIENVVSSLTSSHLFDFVHGWLYVLGVGILGGVTYGDRLMANESVASSRVNSRSKPQGRRD